MAHTLPDLPYAQDALAPHISKETLEYHHGKHHAGYVKKLNAALEGSGMENTPLEDLIREIAGKKDKQGLFNNAAQHFNHSFYWNSLSPGGGGQPSGDLAKAINDTFGGFDKFKEAFTNEAGTHFGSGWGWLVKDGDALKVVSTHDADTPVAHGQTPIITVDVWEHAYYIDYRNARPDYLTAWWNLVNWEFAAKNFG